MFQILQRKGIASGFYDMDSFVANASIYASGSLTIIPNFVSKESMKKLSPIWDHFKVQRSPLLLFYESKSINDFAHVPLAIDSGVYVIDGMQIMSLHKIQPMETLINIDVITDLNHEQYKLG